MDQWSLPRGALRRLVSVAGPVVYLLSSSVKKCSGKVNSDEHYFFHIPNGPLGLTSAYLCHTVLVDE